MHIQIYIVFVPCIFEYIWYENHGYSEIVKYLILHDYTIYLPIREPWDNPTRLNYFSEKTGCYYILLQACSAYVRTSVKIELISPLPISIHSACPPVPFWISFSNIVNFSSEHFWRIPWNMTVGTAESIPGPKRFFA